MKEFIPGDVRMVMCLCVCVCLWLSSNIIYLLCWVFVSEDISCLCAEVRLHVLFITTFYMTCTCHIDV